MSVKETIILNPSDLKYLLIDSLNQYTNNTYFIDGKNPYRFSINKKKYYILIKNIHESGDGRSNQDECRIQVAKSKSFNPALNEHSNVIILGYFHDERVFTAWNPFMMQERFNKKDTISLYSRFSIQREAAATGIANYVDNNNQSVISFKPQYLGLYLENYASIHLFNQENLKNLIEKSDEFNSEDSFNELDYNNKKVTITHTRYKRDPKFRLAVYNAYKHKCAMCGIQLELVEAAHIIPHSDSRGTDEVSNGICLCKLHHGAYDNSLIYVDEDFNINFNDEKINYLIKMEQDAGIIQLQKLTFEKLKLPNNPIYAPNTNNLKIANQLRGINTSLS
tara:strand:- start:318 stop:1325 length:1008 start_codon:yes stop_codon:yes gene_type:complete